MPLHTINHAFSYVKLPYNITVEMVSNWIFVTILSCIVAGLTLPIRSICWSLWYKNLSDIKDTEQVKDTKRSKKITRKTKMNIGTNSLLCLFVRIVNQKINLN